MREIKFRAFYKGDVEEWESEGNARMIYDIQDAYDGMGFDDPEGGFGWVSCFSDFMNDEKISVMQYTGLKDKNGIEIYEGDVIECLREGNGFVTKRHGAYGIETRFGFYPFIEIHGELEVIGNVFQNGGLLNTTNCKTL